jgi:signal transduction histidine kinase
MSFRHLYRRTIAASLATAILSFPFSALFYFRLQEEKKAAAKLTAIREEIETTDELLTQLLNLETGLRGYASTGNKRFLDTHWEGKRQVPLVLSRLEQIKPNQELKEKVRKVLELSDLAIQQGPSLAKLEVGKDTMDEIRQILGNFKRENELIRDRIIQERQTREQRDIALVTGSSGTTLLLLWLVYQSATNMKTAFRKAEKALGLEEELRRKAEESLALEERLRSSEELARVEAQKSLKKERELSESKSRVISVISHEYRNPLTAIYTAAELLENPNITSDKKARHLHQIKQAVNRLTDMTNDVLALLQFEAAAVSVKIQEINLPSWFTGLIESFHDCDRVILDIKVERINCDESLLYKIFSNLISNALKYSRDLVFVSVVAKNDKIQFKVKDSGIGIPESMRIFQAFERGDNVGTIQGNGLGLSIVKRATDLLNGEIELTSTEGEGSEFLVIIPS